MASSVRVSGYKNSTSRHSNGLTIRRDHKHLGHYHLHSHILNFEKSPFFPLYATFQPTTMEFNLSKPNRKIHAGVILTKGVTEMLDVAPFEFFAWTDKTSRQMLNLPQEMWEDDIEFDLHWITEDGKPAQMKSRAQIQPTDSFESCPPLDIALMGAHDLKYKTSEAELAFIRKVYEQCSAFLTICGGMFPLLEAGLLAGKTATCPRMIVSAMKKSIPVVDWVETRWAHDGKLWTSSSLLNGTDMMRAFAEATWGGKTNNGWVEAALDIGGYPVRDVGFKDFKGHHYAVDQLPF
ncbi:hypothetical protein CMEL01_15566 [Colletotrichum melonis]|uniref:DJ-1/PfpI domain-containing protein n=1 Tax=Colletotrichum melonis TaxID=1209925 RepID=A0AAI9XSP8_9PEZI|nr:hypothetical protein CMEL01_15566 [Colletotrichum melonis]